MLRWLSYVVQTNHLALVEGDLAARPADELPLYFMSTQAACQGLACLACTPGHGRQARLDVGDMLIATHALDEVCRSIVAPSDLDPWRRAKLENAEAAASLVGELAPLPAAEELADAHAEPMAVEKDDLAQCLPRLERLLEQSAQPLLDTLAVCDDRRVFAAACRALARLASSNETCARMLELGVVRITTEVLPRQPVLPLTQEALDGTRDDPERRRMRDDTLRVLKLPVVFWELLGALGRLPEGKHALLTQNLLRRALERLALDNGRPKVELAVHGAVASIVARCANSHALETGSANDLLVAREHGSARWLVRLLANTGYAATLRGRRDRRAVRGRGARGARRRRRRCDRRARRGARQARPPHPCCATC